jgi:hypothetical protein
VCWSYEEIEQGDENVSERIEERICVYPDDGLPCAVAHYIAADLGVTPLQVGETADRIGVRIILCQLGLFGYAAKGRPGYRIRHPMEDVPEPLERAIRDAAVDGRVSCAALWRIGAEQHYSRPEMGNAVEALGLKVKPCQLGFF